MGSETCHAAATEVDSSVLAAAARAALRVPIAAARPLMPSMPLLASANLGLLLAPVDRAEHAFDGDVRTPVADREPRLLAVADVVLDRVLDPLGEGGVTAEQI